MALAQTTSPSNISRGPSPSANRMPVPEASHDDRAGRALLLRPRERLGTSAAALAVSANVTTTIGGDDGFENDVSMRIARPRLSSRESITEEELSGDERGAASNAGSEARSEAASEASSDEELEQLLEEIRRLPLHFPATDDSASDAEQQDDMTHTERQNRFGIRRVDAGVPNDAPALPCAAPVARMNVATESHTGVAPPPLASLAATLQNIRERAAAQCSPLPPGLWAVAETVQAWDSFGADRHGDLRDIIDPDALRRHVDWFDAAGRQVLYFAMDDSRAWFLHGLRPLHRRTFEPRGSFLAQFDVLPAGLRRTAVPNALLHCLNGPWDPEGAASWEAHRRYAQQFFCRTFAPAMGSDDITIMGAFDGCAAQNADMAAAMGDFLQRVCAQLVARSAAPGRSDGGRSIAYLLGTLTRRLDSDAALQGFSAVLRNHGALLLGATVRGHWSQNPAGQRDWIITLIGKLSRCRSRHLIHAIGTHVVAAGFLHADEWEDLHAHLPLESDEDLAHFREKVSVFGGEQPLQQGL